VRQPSTVIPIGKARVDCESCRYGKIRSAAASDPPKLKVGEADVGLAQAAKGIGRLESISWMMYFHKVWFL
jgi:hypothetical protein